MVFIDTSNQSGNRQHNNFQFNFGNGNTFVNDPNMDHQNLINSVFSNINQVMGNIPHMMPHNI